MLGTIEVGVGVLVASSHASAELVELCQPESIRPVDDDRVGSRNVQSVLHDGGGDEYVGLMVSEAQHHVLETCARASGRGP